MVPITDEQAKAIQKLAEFGTAVVKEMGDLVRYFGKAIGAIKWKARRKKSVAGVRQTFIDTLQKFDSLDSLVLKKLYETNGKCPRPEFHKLTKPFSLTENIENFLSMQLEVSSTEVAVSLENLEALRCICFNEEACGLDDEFPPFNMTAFGNELVRASILKV